MSENFHHKDNDQLFWDIFNGVRSPEKQFPLAVAEWHKKCELYSGTSHEAHKAWSTARVLQQRARLC